MRLRNTRPSSAKSTRDRSVRPALEGLEDRFLLYATTGNRYDFGSRITWSIVPDGTSLGGTPSNLVSTMNGRFGSGNWQKAIQDAFATWENVANVNFVQVSDDGSATNAGGYQQGSPSIGDIRIGGMAQNSGVLGFCLLPPDSNGGSDAGDIFLNTSQGWQLNGNYDLESVMIHEVGHALGMDHSTDSGAAMYANYTGVHQYVNSDDVAGVQSIWGARQPDGFTLGNANYTSNHAVDVTAFRNPTNQIVLGPLNVVSSSESYWFKVTTPANASSTFSVVTQSAYLSELSPKFAIYDAGLRGLVQVAASSTCYGAIIGASIQNVQPGTTFYVKVSGSNAGPTGTGAYGLLINMGPYSPPLVSPPNTQVAAQPDQGGGGSNQDIGSGISPDPSGDPTDSAKKGKKDKGDHGKGNSGLDEVEPPTWINLGGKMSQGDYLGAQIEVKLGAQAPVSVPDFLPDDPAAGPSTLKILSNKKDFVATLIDMPHPVGPA